MTVKMIRYIAGIVITGFMLYHSVYFQPLNERLTEIEEKTFDAKAFAEDLWKSSLFKTFDTALVLNDLLENLKSDPQQTFDLHARAIGIGNIGYFKVKGEGVVYKVNENNIILSYEGLKVEIETEFIFGNAVRDASGLIRIEDFTRTSDINAISEEINKLIRERLIPPFRKEVKKGNKVRFTGAIELNRAYPDIRLPEVIPLTLQILP